MKSKEELLKPRYKVIAAYPLSHLYFKVGDVLLQFPSGGFGLKHENHLGMHEDTVKDYPHLFKKLEWWEERSVEDMPQYLKRHTGIEKVFNWRLDYGKWKYDYRYDGNNKMDGASLSEIFSGTPATEEEYKEFRKQDKNKQNKTI